MRGKLVVIFLFLVAAVVATAAYAGRNEFNDAVYESADVLRKLGSSYDTLYDDAYALTIQSTTVDEATATAACNFDDAQTNLQSASDGLALATGELEELLNGVGEKLSDAADIMEDNAPQYVDLGLGIITTLVWLNVFLGVIAIMTDHCKCDDCLVLVLGSLTLILLMILTAIEMTLAVAISDFCYKGPETAIGLALDDPLLDYYLTCNGTNPLYVQRK